MARAKTSKSAKIRAALTATPGKPAVEIAKELKVTPALVYNVKASLKNSNGAPKGKSGRKFGKKSAAKAVTAPAADTALDMAFEFVTKVGGLLHAEQLIGRLKAIKERL